MRMQLLYDFGEDDTDDDRVAVVMGPQRAQDLALAIIAIRDHIRHRIKYAELTEEAERELEVIADELSDADTEWVG